MSIAVVCKAVLSLIVAGALLSAYCIAGIAEQADGNSPLGVLNGTGAVTVNGNKALSGASIFSGNVISTGADGVATLDLRQFGRVVVRPSTTITLSIVGNSVQITEKGKSVLVAVMSGSAQVASSQGNKVLNVSQQSTFSGDISVTLTPGSVVVIQNQGSKNQNPGPVPAGHTINPPWWGYLVLGGVAGGVAAGVATHGGENKTPSRTLSPSVP